MNELQTLTELIQQSKRYIRFDKAPLFKAMDSEEIALLSATYITKTLDQPMKLQALCASLGRIILGKYDDFNEPEHIVNKNNLLCGWNILKILLNEGILSKSLDKEVEGKDENGKTLYKRIKVGNTFVFKKNWMVKVADEDFINNLFYLIPVDMNHKSLPTVNEPKERKGFMCDEGGALVSKLNRTHRRRFIRAKIPNVYRDVNKLQKTRYNINRSVLSFVLDNKDIPLLSYDDKKNIDADTKTGLERDKNCTIALAKQFDGEDFYFYYSLDRRGRYYCSSSYLTPQGGKLAKSLLMFAKKEEIGQEGWFWLGIHSANTFGMDKLKLDDRFDWFESNEDKMIHYANNPRETYDQWSKADDPLNFLAACFEVRDANLLEDKYKFKSGLPIQFDATTSGLQILSMISRDEITGGLCNLTASNEVGDSYLYIADKVWSNMPLNDFWKAFEPFRRKLVKRSCMTYLYSCGKKSMGKHIWNDFKTELDINKEECSRLGEMIYDACKKYFVGPSQIMKLFIDAGTKLGKENKLVYLEGLYNDFPFIQHYMIPETGRIDLKNNGERMNITYITKQSKRPDIMKIATSSSPNIVHHLDSQLISYLVDNFDDPLTVVHDCAGSNATHAGKLYEVFREGFYELFGKNDVLQMICDAIGVENTIKYGKLDVEHCLDNQFLAS